MKHRLLLIGCGNMASVHCKAMKEIKNMRLAAAVDRDMERARSFQKTYGFERAGTSWEDELAKGDFDVVLVATHWQVRFEIMKACIESGKHVLAEKPLSMILSEVETIFKLANKHHVKVRVGMMERFRPMFLHMKEWLEKRYIGTPHAFSFMHHQSSGSLIPEHTEAAWNYQKNLLQGGATPNVDCGIHKCDLVRMLGGTEPVSVISHGCKLESDAASNNFTHSVFTMSDGTIFTLEDCFSRNTRPFIHMWILGDGGMMQFEYAGSHARPAPGSQEDCIVIWRREKPGTETYHTPAALKPVGPQMESFLKEIENDADLNWHYENVTKATEMVAATVLSEARKEIVKFPLSAKDREDIGKLFWK